MVQMSMAKKQKRPHELVGFVAIWAVQYQNDYGLNGLHPIHYDLLKKYGARMDSFTRATNAPGHKTISASEHKSRKGTCDV